MCHRAVLCDAGDAVQGFVHAKQALNQLSYSSSPICETFNVRLVMLSAQTFLSPSGILSDVNGY